MKKSIVMLLAVLASMLSGSAYAGDRINQRDLPTAAREFLAKYFIKDTIRKVEKDQGHRGMEYEVDFTNGGEVEFKSDGSWKSVKAARGSVVPEGIVPAAIVKHVAENFEGQSIVEISRKRGGYEVELSNGSELMLTEDAKPLARREGRGDHRPK